MRNLILSALVMAAPVGQPVPQGNTVIVFKTDHGFQFQLGTGENCRDLQETILAGIQSGYSFLMAQEDGPDVTVYGVECINDVKVVP